MSKDGRHFLFAGENNLIEWMLHKQSVSSLLASDKEPPKAKDWNVILIIILYLILSISRRFVVMQFVLTHMLIQACIDNSSLEIHMFVIDTYDLLKYSKTNI